MKDLLKKKTLLIMSLFFSLFGRSQYNVTFQILNVPATHTSDPIYIAGSFNTWSANSPEYKFPAPVNGSTSLTIRLAKGFYEYKFTRGDWSKGESASNGKDVGNRFVKIGRDTTVPISIGGWKDDFPSEHAGKKHTASENVHILDTAFFMPQLQRSRRIWVYLPKDYATRSTHYPVIYMHDGQNLFDEFTAGFGEWGVDEYLDSSSKTKPDCIVVGIDNGPKRMSEYNPYEFRNFGKGEGDAYVTFLAETLKPYIDKKFRTLSDRKNTIIAGSSMGGLISLYAVLKYPKVYGGAGIFSPAFWTAKAIEDEVKKSAGSLNCRLFFYAGGKESTDMIPDMQRIEKLIRAKNPNIAMLEMTNPDAQHNEAAWKHYFPNFYNFVVH